MKKPSIPAVQRDNHGLVLQALKDNVEIMTGQRRNTIAQLPPTATLSEVITTVNQIITTLSVSGT